MVSNKSFSPFSPVSRFTEDHPVPPIEKVSHGYPYSNSRTPFSVREAEELGTSPFPSRRGNRRRGLSRIAAGTFTHVSQRAARGLACLDVDVLYVRRDARLSTSNSLPSVRGRPFASQSRDTRVRVSRRRLGEYERCRSSLPRCANDTRRTVGFVIQVIVEFTFSNRHYIIADPRVTCQRIITGIATKYLPTYSALFSRVSTLARSRMHMPRCERPGSAELSEPRELAGPGKEMLDCKPLASSLFEQCGRAINNALGQRRINNENRFTGLLFFNSARPTKSIGSCGACNQSFIQSTLYLFAVGQSGIIHGPS